MNAIVRKPASPRKPRAPRAKPAVAGSVKSPETLDREVAQQHLLLANRREALRRCAPRAGWKASAPKLESDSLGAQRQAYFTKHADAKYATRGDVNAWVARVCAAAGIACRYDDMLEMIPD